MPDRTATTWWRGDLVSGSGMIGLESSGETRFSFSLASRAGVEEGQTNPEELLAAAQSACYSMQLSALLTRAGTPPQSIATEATVTQTLRDGEYLITQVALRVRAAVPGADDKAFQLAVREAKDTCPVSRALSGTEITVEATLLP